LDAIQVPTYAKYIRDILNKKRPLPSTEVIKLTALCDLGASVSVMPATVYHKLDHSALEPTSMCLQLADQSVRYPLGIADNIPVKI
jgi:hypothetical protein